MTLDEIKQKAWLGLTPALLDELVEVSPLQDVRAEVITEQEEDRIVMPAWEAYLLARHLESTEFKDGYIREMSIIDEMQS